MQGFLRLDRVFVHLSAEHIDKRGAAAAGGAALRSPGSRMRDRLEIAECLTDQQLPPNARSRTFTWRAPIDEIAAAVENLPRSEIVYLVGIGNRAVRKAPVILNTPAVQHC